jgi:imidazolonepropionase
MSKKKVVNNPPPDLVIINANELITMNTEAKPPRTGEEMNDLGIIKSGAIAVKGDKIIFVGTTEEFQDNYYCDETTKVVNAEGQIVLPGFVDPHVHLIFAGTRENELTLKLQGKSYLEILEAGGGILKTVRETRKASVDQLVENGKQILNNMLLYGTTTVEGKSGYGLSTEHELKSLRALRQLEKNHPIDIVPTFLGAHAIPPEFKGKTDDYVKLIIDEMIPQLAEENLAEYIDVFCEEGIFTPSQTKAILQEGKKHGLKPVIHIDEIVDTNGAALAAEVGAVNTGHLLQSNDEGLKAMAKNGVIATLLPGTPFCLMLKEYAPARKMIDLGIPIAISTDLNPNCWIESMQMIIALSCYNMKLTPAEAITAATINAACALERESTIGSLEVGKKADITVFELPNYQFLGYKIGSNSISKVIKNGRIVVKKGQVSY